MAVRMVESLRRFGGRFAQTPVWAVTPRPGPSLARATLGEFERLGVKHVHIRDAHSYQWYNMWNKIAALSHVETRVETDYMGFIDSDVIFLGEPDHLIGGDMTASIHGTKHLGSSGPNDPNEAFWSALCKVAELSVDELPWVNTSIDDARIRLYFNAGIFTYRRRAQFAAQWAQVCRAILDARVGQTESKSHFVEQISFGLTVAKSGVEWQRMPYSHNFDVASWDKNDDKIGLANARVWHYHDSMGAHFWPQLLAFAEEMHPQIYNWLRELGPLADPTSKAQQLLAKSLKARRVLQRNRYQGQMNLY